MRAAALVVAVVLSSCTSDPAAIDDPNVGLDRGPASPAPSPSASQREPTFPGYDFRLPRTARSLAMLLTDVQTRLPRAIDDWLESGGALKGTAVAAVHRGALLQQRIFRLLAGSPELARGVERQVPGRIFRTVEPSLAAQRKLSSLVTPLEPPIRWKTYEPESPHRLLRYYKKGERRHGVPWQVLAAVNAVESRFGRILGPSSAGALGPMQFIPSTWDIYGRGDIMDPHDSILAAARYLAASGAPNDLRGALYAYNRSYEYVDAIQTYAEQITADPRRFYAYYFWEVFVRTTEGDLRLTGPGAARRAG